MSNIQRFIEDLCCNTDDDIIRWFDTVEGTDCDFTARHDEFVYRINCDQTKCVFTVNGKNVFLNDTDRVNLCRAITRQKKRMSEIEELIKDARRSLAKASTLKVLSDDSAA